MRVVLDADVYLCAIPRLRDQDSPPRRIIAAWLAGGFDAVISDHIIEEVTRNLQKPWFVAAAGDIDAVAIFGGIREVVELVNSSTFPTCLESPAIPRTIMCSRR